VYPFMKCNEVYASSSFQLYLYESAVL
jgi:hypothetical protein